MASCRRFVCDRCGFSIKAWDDGNPYIVDLEGVYHYFYHPGRETRIFSIVQKIIGHRPTPDEVAYWLNEHGGNRSDMLCLDCAHQFKMDLERENGKCPQCGSENVADLNDLEGRRCPKCKVGKFEIDRDFYAIS